MKFISVFLILGSLVLSNATTSISLKMPIKKALDTAGTIYEDLSESKILTYYNEISVGDKGETLLTKLDTLLKRNIRKCYYSSGSSKSSANWNGYYLTERNWELSPLESSELSGNYKTSGIYINQLYCKSPIYIESSINSGNYKYQNDSGTWVTDTFANSSKQIDREHVFAKSYGFNGGDISYDKLTVGCDPHNLHAGEHNGNSSAHNNLPFGIVVNKNASTSKAYTSGMTGENVGYTGLDKNGIKVYEPPEQDKGDIARTMFYMAACYHKFDLNGGTNVYPALALINNSNTDKTKDVLQTESSPAQYGQLDALLAWNKEDPVSAFEIHRNNLIYNSVGYNRNPFIDYPDWAEACFAPSESEGASFDNLNGNADSKLKVDIPETYKKGNGIEITVGQNIIPSITATYDDNPVSFKLINEATNTQIADTSTLQNGKYTVHFEIEYDELTYKSPQMKLRVLRTTGNLHDVRLEIDEATVKLKYGQGDHFDPTGIKVYLDDAESTTYSLYNNHGDIMTSEYQFFGAEKMKIYAQFEIDGDIYKTNEFEIEIEVQLIIIVIIFAVIVAIILIIIIVIASTKSRKKRRQQVKTMANIVKKTGKAIKKKYK